MTKWPVIVEQLSPTQAVAVYCEECDWTGRQDNPENGYIGDVATCPRCHAFALDYCYWEGDKCGGCGVLAVDHPVRDGRGVYCTRRCLLQAEYAWSLLGEDLTLVKVLA